MIKMLQPDMVLGNRYRLVHQAGKGGMALVYEAYDQMLERPVAVKILRQDFRENEGFRDRFRQEAKSAANLSHPNIVTVHDFGFDDDFIYIIMEFIRGTDLKTKIHEKGFYSVEEGIPLILQACAGLGYAHRAGIVHCDVKPQNMLVTSDNRLKITDFGIARALSAINPQEKSEVVWGSPQYLSPEQAMGAAPTPASDVYSLGVVIYEMFTGHLPFEGSNSDEMASSLAKKDPILPRHYNPSIPESLEKIILKVLSPEPAQRFRTADQLGRILQSFDQKNDQYLFTPSQVDLQENLPTQLIPEMLHHSPQMSGEDKVYPDSPQVDWKTIGLELICILMAGGLIPFWMYIWFTIRALLR